MTTPITPSDHKILRLPLPTMDDVALMIAEVNAAEDEKEWRARDRQREVRQGQTVCAIVTIIALIIIFFWVGQHWLLP